MRPTKATRYPCPGCGEYYEDRDEAQECCETEEVEGFVCGECGEFYEDREDAKRCCK